VAFHVYFFKIDIFSSRCSPTPAFLTFIYADVAQQVTLRGNVTFFGKGFVTIALFCHYMGVIVMSLSENAAPVAHNAAPVSHNVAPVAYNGTKPNPSQSKPG
jgi:hypothetical protein